MVSLGSPGEDSSLSCDTPGDVINGATNQHSTKCCHDANLPSENDNDKQIQQTNPTCNDDTTSHKSISTTNTCGDESIASVVNGETTNDEQNHEFSETNQINDTCSNVETEFIVEVNQETIDDVTNNQYTHGTSISDFYRDRHVIVTGSTGFLGQGLVAKLLHSCPGIRRITLPLRVFETSTLEQRFDDLLKKEAFSNLLAEKPDLKSKLVPMRVQFDDKHLGQSAEEYTALADDVSVIIHAAASTRLVDPLRQAIEENVGSTKNVLELAKQCKHLKAFVYISTAFSQLKEEFIKEEVPSDVTSGELYDMVDRYDFPRLYDPRKMYDRIGSPCSYMFSKRLAEHVVSECTEIPRAIVRPCIITSALSEPSPGWTTGYVGFNSFMKNLSRKDYRYFPGKKNNFVEIIPVDLAVNSIIAGAWFVGTGRQPEACSGGAPFVINLHSSDANPMTVNDIVQYLNEYYENKANSSFRIKRTGSRTKASLVAALRNLLPIAAREIVTLKIRDRRCKSKRVMNGIIAMHMMSYNFFKDRPREYTSCIRMKAEMTEQDRKIFFTDPGTIQWREYMFDWLDACRAADRK